jgi:hypothetical protein
MLILILVSVIPIALLGSLLGASSAGRRSGDGAQDAWWAPEVEHRARPDHVREPEEALGGWGSPLPALSQMPPNSNARSKP